MEFSKGDPLGCRGWERTIRLRREAGGWGGVGGLALRLCSRWVLGRPLRTSSGHPFPGC